MSQCCVMLFILAGTYHHPTLTFSARKIKLLVKKEKNNSIVYSVIFYEISKYI